MPTGYRVEIGIIPCMVCGDKSNGVHYGVITCEGCKGFFRRYQRFSPDYQCNLLKRCTVDKVNRNKCRYCRLQKCLLIGMGRDVVRLGRRSGKQLEKIEEEIRFHREQQRQAKENTPVDQQTASSSDENACGMSKNHREKIKDNIRFLREQQSQAIEGTPDGPVLDQKIASSSDENAGGVSKKHWEKVEDGVREQQSQAKEGTTDGPVFDQQTAGSSDGGNGNVDDNNTLQKFYEFNGNSTTASDPIPSSGTITEDCSLIATVTKIDDIQFSDLLNRTIADPHSKKCTLTLKEFYEMFHESQDASDLILVEM